ncbi:hypothetical protein D3C72_978990 [compost metagenome]
MIYLWLYDLNPLVPSFIVCPILAILIGLLFTRFKRTVYIGLIISFFLPLLFIASNLNTLKANIDSWVLYGMVYALITFAVYKLTISLANKN